MINEKGMRDLAIAVLSLSPAVSRIVLRGEWPEGKILATAQRTDTRRGSLEVSLIVDEWLLAAPFDYVIKELSERAQAIANPNADGMLK